MHQRDILIGISAVVIGRQPVVIVLPSNHKFARKTSISAEMLAEERFLAATFETEVGLFQHTAALGQQGNFVARIVDRIPDIFTTVTLVAAGAGIAVVPQSCSCLRIPGWCTNRFRGRPSRSNLQWLSDAMSERRP